MAKLDSTTTTSIPFQALPIQPASIQLKESNSNGDSNT